MKKIVIWFFIAASTSIRVLQREKKHLIVSFLLPLSPKNPNEPPPKKDLPRPQLLQIRFQSFRQAQNVRLQFFGG